MINLLGIYHYDAHGAMRIADFIWRGFGQR
jgi:hypothetical protein